MVIGVVRNIMEKLRLVIGTHNGIFHIDETLAVVIMELAFPDCSILVVRSRDASVLSTCDVVFDVGGGIYDHHSVGFNIRRPTGELYASAGLAWREHGEKVIRNIAAKLGAYLTDEDVKAIKEEIDHQVFLPIDMEDNGEKTSTHLFSSISYFLPSWLEEQDFDSAFMQAESNARETLYQIVKTMVSKHASKYYLEERFSSATDGVLEIPAQTMPWKENIVTYNKDHDNKVKFVIFPYPDGGWAAQCVPPSMEKEFDQLVSFPAEWAGVDLKTLRTVSGISDALFCHRGRFFVRAASKESVIEMCRIAMKAA